MWASLSPTKLSTGPDGPGWQWQMNLHLLGDHLDQIGGWPELDVEPYPGPVLWVAGERSDYVRPEYAEVMRALFPRTQLVTVKGAVPPNLEGAAKEALEAYAVAERSSGFDPRAGWAGNR